MRMIEAPSRPRRSNQSPATSPGDVLRCLDRLRPRRAGRLNQPPPKAKPSQGVVPNFLAQNSTAGGPTSGPPLHSTSRSPIEIGNVLGPQKAEIATSSLPQPLGQPLDRQSSRRTARCPAGPAGPAGPVGPISPLSPLGPGAPAVVSPLGPCGPGGPATPAAPISPLSPLGPTAPAAPVSPLRPC